MAVLITSNIQQGVISFLFGTGLIGYAYAATKNKKVQKNSPKGLLKYPWYRKIYASFVVTVIFSVISVVVHYLVFDPTWSRSFNFTIYWDCIFAL